MQRKARMKIEIDFKITESAIAEFKKALVDLGDEGSSSMIRVSIQGGGCSGFAYGLGFVSPEEVEASDVIEEYDGIKVVVDKKSLLYLDGTTIDWIDDPSHRGFKFENPNSQKTCGCKKQSCH